MGGIPAEAVVECAEGDKFRMLPYLVRVEFPGEGPGDDQRDDDRLKRRMEVPARVDPVATRRLSRRANAEC